MMCTARFLKEGGERLRAQCVGWYCIRPPEVCADLKDIREAALPEQPPDAKPARERIERQRRPDEGGDDCVHGRPGRTTKQHQTP